MNYFSDIHREPNIAVGVVFFFLTKTNITPSFQTYRNAKSTEITHVLLIRNVRTPLLYVNAATYYGPCVHNNITATEMI